MKFPLATHSNLRLKITQGFGDTSHLAFYKENGINIPFHNGLDVVLVDLLGRIQPQKTYGSRLITPSYGWQVVKRTFDNPMSTKGNGVTIQSSPFSENGKILVLQVVLWHCSEVVNTAGLLPEYTTVGYVGNSGVVSPAPTPNCPYCGSHLHLMLYEFEQRFNGLYLLNSDNGVGGAIDPLKRFSIDDFVSGEDTSPLKDTPPLQWALSKLWDLIRSLRGY